MFTRYSRSLNVYDREREFMIRQVVPAAFLPGSSELGRTDLF